MQPVKSVENSMLITRSVETSPRSYARLAGVLYLALIILGILGGVVRGRFIVSGNAAATAARLISMEPLWRIGIIAELLALFCVIVLAMIYYVLFKPVSREINLLATFCSLLSSGSYHSACGLSSGG
jgi:Domain of unknown function (DUF4386)